MPLSRALKIGVLAAAFCLSSYGQGAPAKEAATETKGMPPRATPADYQAHASAGAVTIAAEVKGHAIPTPQGALSTEEYVVVELGLFGAADARVKVSADDFSLRINGKKSPLPSQPYGMVVASVKDPEWEPPAPPASKSKTSMGGGGRGEQGEASG